MSSSPIAPGLQAREVSRPELTLAPVSGREQHAIATIARLHAELLPHSPVVLLGPEFAARFYYRVLPREGFIGAHVAYVDGEPAGFVCYTSDASGFMAAALRRHLLRVVFILATASLRRPSGIAAIREALAIMRGLAPEGQAESTGELLSFGVRPEFRSGAFSRRTNINVAGTLLDTALADLRVNLVRRVRAIVDQDNVAAKLFYRGAGWKLGNPNVPGWRIPTCEFVYELSA